MTGQGRDMRLVPYAVRSSRSGLLFSSNFHLALEFPVGLSQTRMASETLDSCLRAHPSSHGQRTTHGDPAD